MLTVTNLRKIFTEQGVKGASKWKREDFNSTIIAAEFAAHAEDAARKPVAKAAPKRNADGTLRGKCTDGCGRPITKDVIGPELCAECLLYAEWENAHSDGGHATGEDVNQDMVSCPVCHPELDPRNVAPKSRSRAGMVIIAKGTEVHKSLTFKEAAEKMGWTVEIERETYELDADAEGEGTRHFATATRGDESISLAWDGRAYDYHASSAVLKGKSRKVRNLKEALRLI